MSAVVPSGNICWICAVDVRTDDPETNTLPPPVATADPDVEIVLMPSCGLGSPTQKTMRELGQDPAFYARLAAPTAPFNVSGNPAMCLPAGVTPRGTPLGVQFIGREFAEQLLVQAGHAFQQVTEFHRGRPPL